MSKIKEKIKEFDEKTTSFESAGGFMTSSLGMTDIRKVREWLEFSFEEISFAEKSAFIQAIGATSIKYGEQNEVLQYLVSEYRKNAGIEV